MFSDSPPGPPQILAAFLFWHEQHVREPDECCLAEGFAPHSHWLWQGGGNRDLFKPRLLVRSRYFQETSWTPLAP